MRVVTGDAFDRRHQVVHRLFGQTCGDFRAETGSARGFLHDHAAAGLGNRFGNGVEVQRAQRGHVDDFGTDAFAGECVGRFQRFLDLRAPGHQGDIGAVAQHEAHIQRQRLPIVGHHFLVLAIDGLGLHVDHRIRVADRGQQQAIGTS